MLKKYGKAIEQPRGTLPLHFTVSRRMDNPESKRRLAARALCWVVPCFTSEGRGLPSRHPQPHFPFGSRPLPSTERGLLRKAEPRQLEDGRSRRWRGQRRPRQALLAVCVLLAASPLDGGAQLGCPGEAEVPFPLHFRRPCHLHASLCRAGPRFLRRQWSKIERQSQPAVLYKKRGGYGQWEFRNKFNFGFPTFSDHKN